MIDRADPRAAPVSPFVSNRLDIVLGRGALKWIERSI
jgi:hypothetical protein